jgi:hypothetical protein
VRRYEQAAKDWETFSKDFHSFRQRSFTKNAVVAVQRILDSAQADSRDQSPNFENGLFRGAGDKKTRIYFLETAFPLSEVDKESLKTVRENLTAAYEVCAGIEQDFSLSLLPPNFGFTRTSPNSTFTRGRDCGSLTTFRRNSKQSFANTYRMGNFWT